MLSKIFKLFKLSFNFSITLFANSTLSLPSNANGFKTITFGFISILFKISTNLIKAFEVEPPSPATTKIWWFFWILFIIKSLSNSLGISNKLFIIGITVPGMPIGSPGMEQGNTKQAYNILYVNKDGSTGVYESH